MYVYMYVCMYVCMILTSPTTAHHISPKQFNYISRTNLLDVVNCTRYFPCTILCLNSPYCKLRCLYGDPPRPQTDRQADRPCAYTLDFCLVRSGLLAGLSIDILKCATAYIDCVQSAYKHTPSHTHTHTHTHTSIAAERVRVGVKRK